jgi:acyl dehydratase
MRSPTVPATDAIGKPIPPQTVVIERGPVSNFAKALQSDSPVHVDPAAARAAGFADIPAPPTYSFAMHHWGAFAELQPEGSDAPHPTVAALGELFEEAGGGLVLHGGQEFVYHRPIVVGDVLTAHGSVTDVYAKESSGGATMTFIVTETEWRDADGEPVVTSTMTLIHRA